MKKAIPADESERLELLWRGEFGNAYVDRNRNVGTERKAFWKSILASILVERVLEVGCNVGGNLRWIAQLVSPGGAFGIDVNAKALTRLAASEPRVGAVRARARELPFRDREFDLTFTMGVLIHVPPDDLPRVMAEILRCSRRYILCGEYHAVEPTEVRYRGRSRALFKRDFGTLYESLFPEIRLRKRGFLSRAEGWDDVTYWVFERAE